MGYTRRRFLHTLVVSASAVALGSLSGCHDSDSNNPPDTSSTPAPPPPPAGLQPGAKYFPQSLLSGDPRPDSVILWTRVEDKDGKTDIDLQLQLATDETFEDVRVNETLTALAANDHCLKVRITNLEPYRHYYYRFVYDRGGVKYVSRTGRTKTAPVADADQGVKFAFVNCQDYLGRYYNNYLSLLDNDDLDFVVHLGDYIYETTGDEQFQSSDGRGFEFDDIDGAIRLGSPDKPFYAAKSLANYRQLYKVYRGDQLLQEVHERFPMITTWDDHEFSDDSWQDHATFTDGARPEQDLQRKRDAERAYFDYMPIDHEAAFHKGDNHGQGALSVDEGQLYPNTTIYRDFHFGRHLQLVMSDFRSHRPDHLIPEDAFPGTVVMDQQTTVGVVAGARGITDPAAIAAAIVPLVQARFFAYINIDDAAYHLHKTVLTEVVAGLYADAYRNKLGLDENSARAKGQTKAAEVMTGKLAVDYLNRIIAAMPDSFKAIYNLSAIDSDGLERGLAYMAMGKTSLFSELGSRYMVVKDTFDLYAGYRAMTQGAGVQNAYGDAQMAWLGQTFSASSATWKLLGSSVSFAPLLFDISSDRVDTGVPPLEAALDSDSIPSLFKQRFYLNVDHWDGFPQGKQALIDNILSPLGVVTLSGDIHASFVSEHKVHANGKRSFGFTASSLSSATQGSFIDSSLQSLAASLAPEAAASFKGLNPFWGLLSRTASQRDDVPGNLAHADFWSHGVAIVNVGSEALKVTLHQVPGNGEVEYIKESFYDKRQAFLDAVQRTGFTLKEGQLTRD